MLAALSYITDNIYVPKNIYVTMPLETVHKLNARQLQMAK